MNISPVLLLVTGCLFAVGYAAFITVGWAITRKNRRNIQNSLAVDNIPIFDISTMKPSDDRRKVKSLSLKNNNFLTNKGEKIDIKKFKIYIVEGESISHPKVSPGNLIFIDDDGDIKYVFDIPDLKEFR